MIGNLSAIHTIGAMHYPLLAGIVLAGACLLMLPYRPGVAATVLIAMVVVATMIAGRREGFDSTTAANYGDYIEIQHVTTAARDPTTGFLVNSPASYWKTGSSMQISVNCAADQHWQSIWRLRGPASSQLPSGPVKDGDTIRLQERFTGRLLSGSGTTLQTAQPARPTPRWHRSQEAVTMTRARTGYCRSWAAVSSREILPSP